MSEFQRGDIVVLKSEWNLVISRAFTRIVENNFIGELGRVVGSYMSNYNNDPIRMVDVKRLGDTTGYWALPERIFRHATQKEILKHKVTE